jgi:hypothetical protein
MQNGFGIHKQKLNDQYLQEWNDLANKSTSSLNFRLFKDMNFGMNKYVYIAPNYF